MSIYKGFTVTQERVICGISIVRCRELGSTDMMLTDDFGNQVPFTQWAALAVYLGG